MGDRNERLDVRLTPEERRAYAWAAREDGADGISAWLRQLANQRVRKLRKESDK